MQIDVVTLFPDYFEPLGLSLPGKAAESGLINLRVHHLREWTHDRHRTVDDTPYGGGAGMVLKPEPWGEAFDALGIDDAVVIVPTPAGVPLTQALARAVAHAPRLVFACGRYEGIDQRVVEYAEARAQVREISLGDFVLNGGEVAALAIIEAVVRLLPGFMGNPQSLAEESHVDGLLEYPVYTKPQHWRGLDVPAVLLGGHHGEIAAWRRQESQRRTAMRRPDLMPPSALIGLDEKAVGPHLARRGDAAELWALTRACWVGEAHATHTYDVAPLTEGLDAVTEGIASWTTWLLRAPDGRLVASVRARAEEDRWVIARLMVAPDLVGRGLGRSLLAFAESQAPSHCTRLCLELEVLSPRVKKMVKASGYRPRGEVTSGVVLFDKANPARA